MGHVNHAVYLQYMETARVELAKRLGMIRGVSNSSFIVAMAHAEYKQPIRDEKRVTVSCWVSRIGGRSWDLDYTIGSGRTMFAKGRTTQVGYDYKSRRTVRVTEKTRKNLESYTGLQMPFRTAL